MNKKKEKEKKQFRSQFFNMEVKFIKVKSSTTKGLEYTVRIFETGEVKCECPGFVFNGKCKHVKKVARKLLSSLQKVNSK